MPLFEFRPGGRGGPQIVISQPVLEYLIGHGFSVPQVSLILQTSLSTVRCYMRRYGLTVQSMYSTISDVD